MWIGNGGSVRRVRARSCGWSGLWTGTATRGARFDAVDVDDAPTGVYIEHFTHDSVFSRLRIGPSVRVGLTAEWADPAWGRRPASVGNVIEDSHFASKLAGVYLDEGTTRTTVRRSTFADQAWGGIGDYRGRHNRLYGNDFRGIAVRAAQAVRHDHLSSTEIGDRAWPSHSRPSRPSPRSTDVRGARDRSGTRSSARCRAPARSCCTAGSPSGGATTGPGSS